MDCPGPPTRSALTPTRTRSIRIEFFSPASFELNAAGNPSGQPTFFAVAPGDHGGRSVFPPPHDAFRTPMGYPPLLWKGRSKLSAAPLSFPDAWKTTGSLLDLPFSLDFAMAASYTCEVVRNSGKATSYYPFLWESFIVFVCFKYYESNYVTQTGTPIHYFLAALFIIVSIIMCGPWQETEKREGI